jgi:hypothetical protein
LVSDESDVTAAVTAATGAETTRLIPLTARLTAFLTRPPDFFLAAFLAGLAAFAERADFFAARLFAAFFVGRLTAFLVFFAAFLLTTRLAI